MIARPRREYRMSGEKIALRLRLPGSTVASHLRRLGLARLAALELSEPARRYSRARAGELVHLDVKKLACFRRIGHRITGDRRQGSEGAGREFVHVAVDDASRLAYVEVLPDERRQSVTSFLLRALRWFRRQGIRAERVMTDYGSGYLSRVFRKVCRLLHLRHIRTGPYTPKTNGKAERFIHTLLREWAYALPYRSSDSRAADLPRWLRHYNQERPHANLAPPVTHRLAPGLP
jgi:transposase InsO family protein